MKYIELFGGIGGFSYGIRKSWESMERTIGDSLWNKGNITNPICERYRKDWRQCADCVGYYEIDKYAVQTYNKNFKAKWEPVDITKLRTKDIPDHDLLCGGFPCQSFSIAGKRKGFEDTRGTMFFEICRIIKDKRPSLLLLENVKGLLSHDEGRTFATILKSLSELGYDCEWQVLNSKFFGVPQNRERVFIIGHLRGKGFRQIFPITKSDKQYNGIGESNEGQEVAWALRSRYYKDGTNFIVTHNLQPRSADRPALTKQCPCNSGKLYQKCCGVPGGHGHLSKTDGTSYCLDGVNAQAVEICKTIRTGGRGSLTKKHNWDTFNIDNKIRRLTPIECERLQGFPDNWTAGISDTQRYKQLGNAVTTNVIEAIIKKLVNKIGNTIT